MKNGKLEINTLEVAGLESAMLGMRNPMNSWKKADTVDGVIGENDMVLATKLVKAGSEHAKFLRQIHVWMNVNMPRYWWSEFDTYKYNTKNSCSTMHKLVAGKEITLDMFEYDRLDEDVMKVVVKKLNRLRKHYKDNKLIGNVDGMDYWLIRAKQVLPEGYLQLRTVDTNYAELMNIYHQRKNHRLEREWQRTFCRWCESLPYFKELCIDPVKED